MCTITQSEKSLYELVNYRFNTIVENGGKLFTTNVEGLYEAYLENLPAEERQTYNCNACRHFINRFGGLVTINEDGEMISAVWDAISAPKFFAKSIAAMNKLVMKSRVDGIFLSDEKNLGYPKTGVWSHIHAKQPNSIIYRDRVKTAHQAMAEKREEFGMVNRALQDFTPEHVAQALELINAEVLYRGDKAKGNVLWFDELAVKVANAGRNANVKRNLVWLAVVNAPAGFTHIRSNATGTLLKNIAAGYSVTVIAEEFKKVMDPANHMRSQTGPSAAQIYEAEKMIEKMGLAPSLRRRYARLDEIATFWKHKPKMIPLAMDLRPGVFSHLTATTKQGNSVQMPATTMTWDKFQRTVLKSAEQIEVLVDNPNKLMAMVTAADDTAENILQWTNPFSWYYHGGIDAEMKRRIEEAGGRYENNEIRCSLIWEGLTDLDLHCITPRGEHIGFNSKKGRCGGYLDLDMNGLDRNSKTPVENMRWTNNAPEGHYQFYVHNYTERVNRSEGTPFRVELEINGQVYQYEGKALKQGGKTTVFEFFYARGQQLEMLSHGNSSTASNSSWNVPSNDFVKVNAVTVSPNVWNDEAPHLGTHIFFLLDGCKDISEGKGRGFFNEMLNSELRPIRRVLEAYTGSTPIEGVDEANACGVGYSKDQEWNLTVKVTTGNSKRIIKIDRWD